MKNELIDTIYQALESKGKEWLERHGIKDIQLDGDNDSCELIVTTTGQHRELVVSSSAVRELED